MDTDLWPPLWKAARLTRRMFHLLGLAWEAQQRYGWRGLIERVVRQISDARQAEARPAEQVPPPGHGADLDVIYAIGFWPGEPKRYRVFNMAQGLRGAGFRVHVLPYHDIYQIIGNRWSARVLVLFRAEYDRFVGIAQVLAYARATRMRLVYDIDDLVFDPDLIDRIDGMRQKTRWAKWAVIRAMEARRRLLRECDATTASTAPLARAAAALGKPGFVIPNSLNDEQLRIAALIASGPTASRSDIRIGYFSGSRTHQRDFAACEPALLAAMKTHSGVILRLVGYLDLGEAWQQYRARIERIGYLSPGDLLRAVAEVDINLAPLEIGNPFCEAKSELKFFEAGLVRVPTIASATESLTAAIEHGVSGYLVSDDAGWREALNALITSSETRRRVGAAAHKQALKKFGLATAVAAAVDAFGLNLPHTFANEDQPLARRQVVRPN
jgi:glycosyltransferase involved in cell wall biosynthesis